MNMTFLNLSVINLLTYLLLCQDVKAELIEKQTQIIK